MSDAAVASGTRVDFDWLGFAAAPIFLAMALWSARAPHGLCASMQSLSPINDMTTMYLVMSAVHVAPWLRLLSAKARAQTC